MKLAWIFVGVLLDNFLTIGTITASAGDKNRLLLYPVVLTSSICWSLFVSVSTSSKIYSLVEYKSTTLWKTSLRYFRISQWKSDWNNKNGKIVQIWHESVIYGLSYWLLNEKDKDHFWSQNSFNPFYKHYSTQSIFGGFVRNSPKKCTWEIG